MGITKRQVDDQQGLARVAPMSGQIERVLIEGDLAGLSADQRANYYRNVCDSVGLNPLTKPFEYIRLNGKLVLYATRACTDQLRARDGVSVSIVERRTEDGVHSVVAEATMPNGRKDASTGAVAIESLKGEAKANALMKAETKAKRRVTLSICGLGMLDETEVTSIPDATPVDPDTGELGAFLDMRDAIESASTLVELADAWKRGTKGMTSQQKSELVRRKDRKKAELTTEPAREPGDDSDVVEGVEP